MIIKVNNKEYPFDGYVQLLQSIQQLADECYQQGRADAIEECINAIKKHWLMWNVGIIKAVIDVLEKLKDQNE